GHVHAGVDEAPDALGVGRRRADRAHDFRATCHDCEASRSTLPGAGRPVTSLSEPARRIRRAYRAATARSGGVWRSLVTVAGSARPVVDERADEVVRAASVNKLAIACAVLDLVDRGALRLDRRLTLTEDLVVGGSGIYRSQPVFGDRVTVAGALTAMLLVSDNTAVRLCGLVCPGARVNDYLARHGFRHTRVEPVDECRTYLG